jgi:hypothetical protein
MIGLGMQVCYFYSRSISFSKAKKHPISKNAHRRSPDGL